jgi:hypothetical protein
MSLRSLVDIHTTCRGKRARTTIPLAVEPPGDLPQPTNHETLHQNNSDTDHMLPRPHKLRPRSGYPAGANGNSSTAYAVRHAHTHADCSTNTC